MDATVLDLAENSAAVLRDIRRDILLMAEHSSHVAAALSCVEILAALYSGILHIEPADSVDRDLFVLSKGHGCMGLYAVLAHAGFIEKARLATYAADNSLLAEHPLAGKIPWIEFAAGSLGHGLAVAAGMAKAAILGARDQRVFVLMGDGECDEGSVWESAALASGQRLHNLTAIIDANGLQACGTCTDISPAIHLPNCWRAFGWEVIEADGHDVHALREVFSKPSAGPVPRVIVCHTVKGKGVDFMENNLEFHYRPVRGKDREEALRSLENA